MMKEEIENEVLAFMGMLSGIALAALSLLCLCIVSAEIGSDATANIVFPFFGFIGVFTLVLSIEVFFGRLIGEGSSNELPKEDWQACTLLKAEGKKVDRERDHG